MIIGLCGAALNDRGEFISTSRVGKDSIADVLVRKHGFVKLGFADPIRAFVAELCGKSVAELNDFKGDPLLALCGKTPRYAMQTLGTEWGRDMIGTDLWLRYTSRRAAQAERRGDSVVISDVRFPNEARAILDVGGIVIQVIRIVDSHELGGYDGHASEQRLPAPLVTGTVYSDAGFEHAAELALKHGSIVVATPDEE